MGIWSCLGTTLDEVRDSLYNGKSGVIFSQERKDAGFRSALCTDVPKPDLKPFVKRNMRQFMPEEAQYAYMATKQALEMSKMDQEFIDSHEVGIIYGNDSVAQATMEALDKFREFKDTEMCGWSYLPKHELHHLHEPGLPLPSEGHKPHGVLSLLIVESGHRSCRTANKEWSSGLHHLRWS